MCIPLYQTFAEISRPSFGMSRISRPRFAISRLSRPKNAAAFFMTQVETARTSRLMKRRDRRDQIQPFPGFRDRGGYGATFATKAEAARLRRFFSRTSRPTWRRRDSGNQRGNGVTQSETARLKIQWRNQPGPRNQKLPFSDFRNQAEDGANFVTKAETAWLSIPGQKRRDFQYQGGNSATF